MLAMNTEVDTDDPLAVRLVKDTKLLPGETTWARAVIDGEAGANVVVEANQFLMNGSIVGVPGARYSGGSELTLVMNNTGRQPIRFQAGRVVARATLVTTDDAILVISRQLNGDS